MKVVAVSQRVDVFPERHEKRDALDQRLISFLSTCEYMPMPVPNSLGEAIRHWLAVVQPAAVVLSGGNDLGQFVERDKTERVLLAYAQERQLPMLGICRGMQMMAHWSGAKLRPVSGHVRVRHLLTGQISAEVNSYHRFSTATCPEGFEVLARSEDGVIEAIGHLTLPWEGWMWHPEREAVFATRDIDRLKNLFV